MSPSDPYQSRFIKTVIRQTRRWFDHGQTTLRRMQVAASWSTQILLYPIYAFFQTSRLIGQKVEQTKQAYSLGLEEAEAIEDYQIPLKVQSPALTADSPIQNVLQAVQALDLPGEVPVLTKAPDIKIRAIASLIEQKSLVLVTNHNQVLDVLTLEQQQILHKQIIVAIAVYARHVRTRRLRPQWATRFLQGVRNFVQPLLPKQSPAGLARLLPDRQDEDPIQMALFEVRHLLRLSESPDDLSTLTLPALSEPGSHLATQTRQPLPPVYIQGIVSLLPERSLALVTNENAVLNILSPEQQQFIYQRIEWETAHYWRYLERRNQAAGLLPVQPPNKFNRLLAPVAGFQWFMTWMQSGAIALSTNLFQEASQNTCPISPALPPHVAFANRLPYPLAQLLQSLSNFISPQVDAPGKLSKTSSQRQVVKAYRPSQTEIELMNSTASIYVEIGTTTFTEKSFQAIEISQNNDYLDTNATLMGYEQSWLERILHWLDRCFFWVEEWLRTVWQRLRNP